VEAPHAVKFGHLDTIVFHIERLTLTMARAEERRYCEQNSRDD